MPSLAVIGHAPISRASLALECCLLYSEILRLRLRITVARLVILNPSTVTLSPSYVILNPSRCVILSTFAPLSVNSAKDLILLRVNSVKNLRAGSAKSLRTSSVKNL